eukprot:gene7163-7970_t
MADKWAVFREAVRHSLECWPALHIAKQQRLGGDNVVEKLEWLLEMIVQVFHSNDHVYPDELEDYISECLYNEFDMMVQDGTTQKLVETICRYSDLCVSGRMAEVIEELRVPPPTIPNIVSQVNPDDNGSEDESDKQSASAHNSLVNATAMETDQSAPMETENASNDDGWEVVKKSRKKNNKTS